MSTELKSRFEKASAISGFELEKLKSLFVAKNQYENEELLKEAIELTDKESITRTLEIWGGIPVTKINIISKILLGDEKEVTKESKETKETTVLTQLLQSSRPIQQWSDEELLTAYIKKDQEEFEFELNKRAKGRRFIVISNHETEEIDTEATLRMLKRARKEDIPSFYQTGDGENIHIYRIEDYHKSNRIRSESPLRPGIALFDDFCPVSNISFSGVGMSARRFIRLIREVEGEQPKRDEKYLVEIGREKGLDGLMREYPELHDTYMRRSADETLPTLKLVENVTSTYITKSDPFNAHSGKRIF